MHYCVFSGLQVIIFSAWLFCTGSISTADGSALVKVGNTTVICGIKAVNDQKRSSSKFYFNEAALQEQMFNDEEKMPHFVVFLYMQELANPTVEAPGKGYIGEYKCWIEDTRWKCTFMDYLKAIISRFWTFFTRVIVSHGIVSFKQKRMPSE